MCEYICRQLLGLMHVILMLVVLHFSLRVRQRVCVWGEGGRGEQRGRREGGGGDRWLVLTHHRIIHPWENVVPS